MASTEAIESVSCDTLLIGATRVAGRVVLAPGSEPLDAALDGYLSQYLQEVSYKAGHGELVTFPSFGRIAAKSITVAGLGEDPDEDSVRGVAGSAAGSLGERSVVASTLQLATGAASSAGAAAEGFLLGSYRFTAFKSDPHPSKIQRLILLGGASEDTLSRGVARAEATMLARDLTNEPAGSLTPEALAERVRGIADATGLQATVLDAEALASQGFGGIVGVGQGSARPPCLILLRYTPTEPTTKITLIGKGITFDSGGLSIKPAASMEEMKTDMAGAGAVIGALSACTRLSVRAEVTGVIAAAENMVSSTSFRPGDVIRHYGGKTTEVTNTDAEGRLVLADALAYSSEQNPSAMVDVATLTGAIKVALGSKAVGLFSNDDTLASEIESAASTSGERVWRLPLYEDYLKELDSDVADHKNSGGRWGGSIIAAMFLTQFVGPGIPWA
ncbi:MAG: leucyl aminopeptidase, partial [Actinomycetota bacterium]